MGKNFSVLFICELFNNTSIMNNYLGKLWKETVVKKFEALSSNLVGGNKKDCEKSPDTQLYAEILTQHLGKKKSSKQNS
jgi:hypothetical protein